MNSEDKIYYKKLVKRVAYTALGAMIALGITKGCQNYQTEKQNKLEAKAKIESSYIRKD